MSGKIVHTSTHLRSATGRVARVGSACSALGSACKAAAEAFCDLTIALLGPGYFYAEELRDGVWRRFAGGPAWFVVVRQERRGPVRYVKAALEVGR